jgi:hypothetical protein
MEVDAPSRVARRPNVDPVDSDRQRYFAVLDSDGAKQFVVNVLRCTQDVFGVVRRSRRLGRLRLGLILLL